MPYCERCKRNVPSTGMDEHRKRSDRHWFCYRHCIDFTSWNALKEHYVQSRDHHYCARCNEHFDSNKWLLEHLEDVHNFCKTHRLVSAVLSLVQRNESYHAVADISDV